MSTRDSSTPVGPELERPDRHLAQELVTYFDDAPLDL
jgi:hypothetical protein